MSLLLATSAVRQQAPAGGGGFSPEDVSGLALWVDASDTATITDAGSGAVSQWDDKSATGLTFTQATAGRRPITGSVTQNGLNTVDFDGSNDLLVAAAPYTTVTDNFAMFVVIAPVGVSAGTVPVFNGSGDANGFGVAHSSSGDNRVGYLRGGIAWGVGSTFSPTTGCHVLVVRRTSGTWTMYLNGGTSEVGGSAAPNAPASTTLLGGHFTSGVGYLNGSLCEALGYNVAVSDTDTNLLGAHLSTKWNSTAWSDI